MAQADSRNTIITSRFHNRSNEALADQLGHADAVLKGAEAECRALKHELKRRGLLEVVQIAHMQLVADLAVQKPHHITIRGADRTDVEERAQHLVKAFDGFTTYVRAIVDDTADNLPCGTIDRKDRDYVAGCLSDCAAEVVSMVAKAADEIEPEEASFWTRRAR